MFSKTLNKVLLCGRPVCICFCTLLIQSLKKNKLTCPAECVWLWWIIALCEGETALYLNYSVLDPPTWSCAVGWRARTAVGGRAHEEEVDNAPLPWRNKAEGTEAGGATVTSPSPCFCRPNELEDKEEEGSCFQSATGPCPACLLSSLPPPVPLCWSAELPPHRCLPSSSDLYGTLLSCSWTKPG